jgi:hypothetical protein
VTVLIDPPRWAAHDRLWSHLVSDTSLDELHAFAASVGIPSRGFEGDHYDVPQERYAAVVAAGATEVDGRTLLRALQRSGLRTQKRRHEKVVSSTPDAPWLPPGGRADVVLSRQDDAPVPTVVVRLAVVSEARRMGVARPGRGLDLPFREVGEGSVAGALSGLVRSVLDPASQYLAPRLVGYVRNTVERPTADYPWPTPRACFTAYAVEVSPAVAQELSGSWLTHQRASETLADRHWWPLFAAGLP